MDIKDILIKVKEQKIGVEEAAQTAEFFGASVDRIYDVGVSGIHRLFAKLDVIQEASCVVVAAGMEGALASVIGGLVKNPVIAVPTSVGYGEAMERAARGEEFLRKCDFQNVRIRVYGDLARIEVDEQSFSEVLERKKEIIARMHELGYQYVTLDLEGFRSGSMDAGINQEGIK